MCNFCEKIYNSPDEFEDSDILFATNEVALVRDNKDIKLYLSCEDCYYSNFLLKVRYCPICGRKFEK